MRGEVQGKADGGLQRREGCSFYRAGDLSWSGGLQMRIEVGAQVRIRVGAQVRVRGLQGSEEGSDVVMGAAEKPVLPGHPRTQRLCIRGLPGPEDPGFIPVWALLGEPVQRSQEAELHGPSGWSGLQQPLTEPHCSSVRQ